MRHTGFTLIELILYISLAAIILTAGLSLAWNIIFDQAKTTALAEVNYNYQFLDSFTQDQIQSAKAINLAQSILNTNPGRIVLTNPDNSTTVIETENKTVTQGGQSYVLTNLKVTLPGNLVYSLITNKINLTNFVVKYSSTNRQITSDISIQYLNPSQSVHYAASKTWTNTTTIRGE